MSTSSSNALRVLCVAALLAAGSAIAQNEPSPGNAAQSADKPVTSDSAAVQTSEGKIHNTSKDCDALSGKEYDECIQATPAGPADLRTGEGSKAKSEVAVERQEEKAESVGEGVPKQSQDSLGHPEEAGTTGQGSALQEERAAEPSR